LRILGIDPGLRTTGYGVIDHEGERISLVEAGVITTSSEDGISKRLENIHDALQELFAETRPDQVVLEKLYADYRHPTTAILMGHARGVICLVCSQKRVPLVSIPSTRVKKAIISDGHASKEQISRAVGSILRLKSRPKPLDVTDALAIAISYVFTNKIAKEEILA